ncbi:hypothetical protein FQN53_006629 [Emmonsiellopsis sp. PD_33]|nr:hypothetical protein FQN53_006629 [Emmonsiellopsis sp. PD_33]
MTMITPTTRNPTMWDKIKTYANTAIRYIRSAITASLTLVKKHWKPALTGTIAFTFLKGFGAAGIVGGSLAASFQSLAYGAFTPAGGFFALLTSLGMKEILLALLAIVAAILVVWVVMEILEAIRASKD